MQPMVIVRRRVLMSDLGELVPIVLNTSLVCGLTERPRTNTIIDTVTYLVTGRLDGALGSSSEPPWAGATSSRGNHGPVTRSRYPYPTYGGVGPAAGGAPAFRGLPLNPSHVRHDQGGK